MRPVLLLLPLALAACGHEAERRAPPTPLVERMPPVDPARTIEGRLEVHGMTCSGCEYNVRTSLRLVAGVLEAEADHSMSTARVRYDPAMTTLAALAEAVRTTGYEVVEPPAGR